MYKQPLRPDRLRRVPPQFSWVDHRLVREGRLRGVPPDGLALYLFLVTVADAQGMSWYGDRRGAEHLGMDLALNPKTVQKWVDQPYAQRKASGRSSKLDPYKAQIRRMLDQEAYTGEQILREVRKQGYPGGRSILQEDLNLIRPVRKKAFAILSFAPGGIRRPAGHPAVASRSGADLSRAQPHRHPSPVLPAPSGYPH